MNKIGQQHQQEIAKLSLREQYYSAIGRFVVEFSSVEFLLKYIIAVAVKLPDDHTSVVLSHDFAMLCTIAHSVLLGKVDEASQERLIGVIKKCRDLNDRRVRIVHGLWMIDDKSGKLEHASRHKLETRSYYELNAQEIAAEADLANQIFEDLWPFWDLLRER